MRPLPQRLGRALAVLLALAVPVLLVLLVLLPLLRHAERLDEDIRLAAALRERLTETVRQRERLAAEADALAAEVAASDGYLRADTDALAAAVLQRRLAEAAERTGAALVSVQSLPSTRETGFVRVGLRADTVGTLEAVAGLLYEIEDARPYMFLASLSVQPQGGTPAPGSPPEAVTLSASLEVGGYMAPGGEER